MLSCSKFTFFSVAGYCGQMGTKRRRKSSAGAALRKQAMSQTVVNVCPTDLETSRKTIQIALDRVPKTIVLEVSNTKEGKLFFISKCHIMVVSMDIATSLTESKVLIVASCYDQQFSSQTLFLGCTLYCSAKMKLIV